VTTFGTLYLNFAGRLPAGVALGAFRPVSAYAEAVTFLALAGLRAVGVLLAVVHVIEPRTRIPHGTGAWVEWPGSNRCEIEPVDSGPYDLDHI
jgi:hypothetical protein